ncbi:NAD(P)H-dependent FMN reductase [Verrucomicrobium sp. GAS474]|uniref:NADPH-dependent FMN reductase n=1 Tax=Verrucomicrobium sp. GAS474 TaxID=1882831 RepID=UPI00087A2099|nr:NADPH-dependent FMN reductase [Verrucomicrobium sp. GAS474]SDU09814.1 NAD(P)H-dependent FMN reductase [Verrucomicrobium sp. GAS474]
MPLRILAISGSLRRGSSNTMLLRAAASVASTLEGIEIVPYEGLATLPPFNPDDAEDEPAPVSRFREAIRRADGLLISSPEYAHGVPGVLKNALDWLVATTDLEAKPIALLNTSARATHAQASLTETLTVMMGRIVPAASPLIALDCHKGLDAAGMLAEPAIALPLRTALTAFRETLSRP